ncbi:MAG: ATP-binding protein [Pseudomonadota bacterium]
MGYTLFRMHRVGKQLKLINTSYLRLTLVLGELYTIQGNLLNTVAERTAGRGTSQFLRRQVSLARQFRLHDVQRAAATVQRTQGLELGDRNRQFLQRTRSQLQQFEQDFKQNEGLFDRLFAKEVSDTADQKIGEDLLQIERKLAGKIRVLRNELRGLVKNAGAQVAADQHYAVWAGLGLTVLALLVSLIVTFRSRGMLRPLKTLVDGTKRIGSGDYAGRVDVKSQDELGVLAGEFNNMAAAVEEREQKLIRSERLAAAGRLASHITHEVRNPLSSISLNTEMLEEELAKLKGERSQEIAALCHEIQKEVDRLTGLTEQYLGFARLPKPNLDSEDVNEILNSLLSFMREELKGKGVTVRCSFYDGLVPLQADENQLRQAFLNLVRNAGEAMEKEGGTLEIATSLINGAIVIRFVDTGPGIEQKSLANVFEPFFSTKKGGTGLGLALTYQIIHEHGGTIGVSSSAGEGTVFTVSLPTASARDKVNNSNE